MRSPTPRTGRAARRPTRSPRPRLEPLEGRTAPSVVPVGGEFRVNSYTTSVQRSGKAAFDAAGDFVVVWQSSGQDGDGYGIYAQRYSSAGVPQGGEFRANTSTTGHQAGPAVAMDAAGDFVIAWNSIGQAG